MITCLNLLTKPLLCAFTLDEFRICSHFSMNENQTLKIPLNLLIVL